MDKTQANNSEDITQITDSEVSNQNTAELTQSIKPTEPLEQPAIVNPGTDETSLGQVAGVTTIPAQKQLPADSYVYANSSNLGGIIQYTAQQYNLDPHQLEALINTLRNKKATLAGFYEMQVGFYPGMSAEALVANLGRVADLSNTISEKKRQEAALRGEVYTSNGMDNLIDSLQSLDDSHDGKFYYNEALSAIQEADHIQFDTPTLTEYYETLVKSGVGKAQAWTKTIQKQDEYRKAQDVRSVYQDFQAMITPSEMQSYSNKLYEQILNTTDSETKLRLYAQYEAAKKLTESYTEAFKNDPAAYLQSKDPRFETILEDASETGNFANVVTNLDERYDEYGIPQSQRKYLRKDQADALSKEIISFLYSEPIKAQKAIANLVQTYGAKAGSVVNQLVQDNQVPVEAKLLVESLRTGSPKVNEAAFDMLKHKNALGTDYDKTMLGAPDTSSAKTLRGKIELELQNLNGFKALAQQFALSGDVAGYYSMLQAYGDMAVYYKFKNPRLSDKKIAELIQRDFMTSVYAFDEDNRVVLQHRTLDGRPILYNGHSAEKAKDYLINRSFSNQKLKIGELSLANSEALLKNTENIRYITLDQFTVQPVYDDGNGNVQALFETDANGEPKTDAQGKRKAFTINLKHLGDEDILDVFEARDNARKLHKALMQMANIPTVTGNLARGMTPQDENASKVIKALSTLGFQVKHFDTTKPFVEQFERANLSPRRIQALSTMLKKQQEFEIELQLYERMKKEQRNKVRPRQIAFELIGPFLKGFAIRPAEGTESDFEKSLRVYMQGREELLPELKAQRVKLQQIEKVIMDEACVYLDYKGKLPKHPLTDKINRHNVLDKVLWSWEGYGY